MQHTLRWRDRWGLPRGRGGPDAGHGRAGCPGLFQRISWAVLVRLWQVALAGIDEWGREGGHSRAVNAGPPRHLLWAIAVVFLGIVGCVKHVPGTDQIVPATRTPNLDPQDCLVGRGIGANGIAAEDAALTELTRQLESAVESEYLRIVNSATRNGLENLDEDVRLTTKIRSHFGRGDLIERFPAHRKADGWEAYATLERIPAIRRIAAETYEPVAKSFRLEAEAAIAADDDPERFGPAVEKALNAYPDIVQSACWIRAIALAPPALGGVDAPDLPVTLAQLDEDEARYFAVLVAQAEARDRWVIDVVYAGSRDTSAAADETLVVDTFASVVARQGYPVRRSDDTRRPVEIRVHLDQKVSRSYQIFCTWSFALERCPDGKRCAVLPEQFEVIGTHRTDQDEACHDAAEQAGRDPRVGKVLDDALRPFFPK